ncbi:c-type cytochrome [Rhodospirillaceae bacterium SYSU D60014]|uniref:c-type cytochrome n=1 Tax=Virgifigura deserti TaxID=2268457 RepID=UPI000E661A21
MSSLELNKIAGAVLVGGIVALASGIIANQLVQPETHETQAVAIAGAEDTGETPAAEEDAGLEPVGPLLASADVAAGESISKRCASCHSFEQGGPNKVGPNLWNIVGAPHGHAEGFSYSDAIAGIEGPWTYEDLNAFLANPREYAPGTKMTFAGLKSVEDRANLIAWLRTLSDDPQPLPEPTAAAEPAEEAAEGAETVPAEDAELTAPAAPAATAQPGEATEGDGAQQAAAPEGGAPEAEGIGALLANADPANGEKIARRCAACHSFEQGGPNKVGPNLWNVVGAPHGHAEGYNYSDAIAGIEGPWTYEQLDAFLANPREYAPGTKMTFAGIRKPEDRADLIAWLRSLSDNPQPLP